MKKRFSNFQEKLFQLFKRKTSSLAFISEIDGLRFLAIFLVVVSHLQGLYLLRRNNQTLISGWEDHFRSLLSNGDVGVPLFFAISGFILMLPFARYYLINKDKVSLKKYYIRRLTRLEPPYLLVIIFLFVMKIIIQKQSFIGLFPHLVASIFYSHAAIYHEMSKITPITWSLEIEIQFYLLAPFLAIIYRLNKPLRMILLLISILILPFIQHILGSSKLSFFGSMQYFLVGFILVDLYLCQDKLKLGENLIKPLGIILLLLLVSVRPNGPWVVFLYPFLMLAFFYLVLNTEFWKVSFQNKVLTSIGGMCYSIYLLHYAIISFVGTKSFALKAANSYSLNILVQSLIQLPIILLVSAVYYLLIEKPCMDPNWPRKLKESLQHIKTISFLSKKIKNKLLFLNIITIIVSLSIFLLFFEAVVRIFIPQPTERFINLFVPDNELGWRLKPNSKGMFNASEFQVKIMANERGFRDITHDYTKPIDTFRIAGIGDSFLFGYGVDSKSSILSILQEVLSKRNPFNKRIETMNFGIPGYNINQYYKILQTEASRYNPDLVIVFFYNNDWNANGSFEFPGGVNRNGFLVSEDGYSLKSIRSFLYPIRLFLKSNSQLFIFVRGKIIVLLRKMHLMSVPDTELYKKDNDFCKKYLHTLELIERMNAVCKQQLHCSFIVCVIPDKTQISKIYRDLILKSNNINPDDYEWFQPQKALSKFCLGKNIDSIDLTPLFSNLELTDRYYFNIDPHWNEKGHRAASEELSKYINLNFRKAALK